MAFVLLTFTPAKLSRFSIACGDVKQGCFLSLLQAVVLRVHRIKLPNSRARPAKMFRFNVCAGGGIVPSSSKPQLNALQGLTPAFPWPQSRSAVLSDLSMQDQGGRGDR